MVIYGITLIPIYEDIWDTETRLLNPFYADNVEFDRSERRGVHLIKQLLEQGKHWGYLPEPANYLFIAELPAQDSLS